jgi:hypothetical protein
VRLRLHPRGDADERPLHSCGSGALRLVGRVEDDERAGRRRRAQLLVGFVVPVHEQPLALDPRPERERQLAEGRDVRAEALLGQEPHQRDVRERLRPVDHERLGRGPLEQPRALAQRVLRVDDERRSEAFRQLRGRDPVDRQHPGLDPGAAREQC